jgi:hypothetical protein
VGVFSLVAMVEKSSVNWVTKSDSLRKSSRSMTPPAGRDRGV